MQKPSDVMAPRQVIVVRIDMKLIAVLRASNTKGNNRSSYWDVKMLKSLGT